MMLHFAYGSNMSRALMARRCPDARALGVATLRGWRFIISIDAVGSIAPAAGAIVHGVLWRLSPRDLAAVNAYERLDSGLYLRKILPVRLGARHLPALTYVARRRGEGIGRPAYVHLVVGAAREWGLPEPYVRTLARWSPSGFCGVRGKDTGELG
jgi:AIG2-like family